MSQSPDVVFLQKLQKHFWKELLLELSVNFTQEIRSKYTTSGLWDKPFESKRQDLHHFVVKCSSITNVMRVTGMTESRQFD